MGIGHHPLQAQIAMRGAALLMVGGLMACSACRYNPIENEAVVAEVLRRCGGALELEVAPASIVRKGEINLHQGVQTWEVCDSALNTYANIQELQQSDLNEHIKRRIKPSMFPPSNSTTLGLHKCIRLLPHRNDTGGFFVALLRKVRPLPGPEPIYKGLKEKLHQSHKAGKKVEAGGSNGFFHYSKVPQDFVQSWLESSGLRNRKSFLSDVEPLLYTRGSLAKGSSVMMSKAVAEHIVGTRD